MKIKIAVIIGDIVSALLGITIFVISFINAADDITRILSFLILAQSLIPTVISIFDNLYKINRKEESDNKNGGLSANAFSYISIAYMSIVLSLSFLDWIIEAGLGVILFIVLLFAYAQYFKKYHRQYEEPTPLCKFFLRFSLILTTLLPLFETQFYFPYFKQILFDNIFTGAIDNVGILFLTIGIMLLFVIRFLGADFILIKRKINVKTVILISAAVASTTIFDLVTKLLSGTDSPLFKVGREWGFFTPLAFLLGAIAGIFVYLLFWRITELAYSEKAPKEIS